MSKLMSVLKWFRKPEILLVLAVGLLALQAAVFDAAPNPPLPEEAIDYVGQSHEFLLVLFGFCVIVTMGPLLVFAEMCRQKQKSEADTAMRELDRWVDGSFHDRKLRD